MVKDLEKYYENADICSLLFKEHEYMKISMPVKLFEYLAHNKPIIATKGTVAGTFVEENGIGFSIKYDSEQIIQLFEKLKTDKELIEKIKKRQNEIIEENTWKARAKKVIEDLIF